MYQKYLTSFLTLAAFFFISLFVLPPVHAGENVDLTPAEYRAKGYEAQHKGNYDQALMYYDKAVSLGENSAAIYNDIGIVYEQLGAYDQAENSYQKAIIQDPNYLPAYANIAYMYKEQGNKQKASKYFQERYNRSSPEDPGREKFRLEIVSLNPEYLDHIVDAEIQNAKKVLQQKQQDNFGEDVSRSERHCQRGKEYLEKKQFEKALTEFDRALALTPDNPKLLREKERTLYLQKVEDIRKRTDAGLQQLDAGDVEAAKTEFQNILTLIPNESVGKSE